MKTLKVMLAVGCLAWGITPAEQANAQGRLLFTLKLCNRTGGDLQLALAHRAGATDTKFRIRGWLDLPRGCYDVPAVPKGWVYWLAVAASGPGYWGGEAANICVSITPFDRIDAGGTECKPDEQLVGFEGKLIETDNFTVTFSP